MAPTSREDISRRYFMTWFPPALAMHESKTHPALRSAPRPCLALPTGPPRVRVVAVALALLCFPAAHASSARAQASETAPPGTSGAAGARVDFEKEIQPIFARHCYKCHGPEKRSGGLRLDEWQHAELGGDSARPILGGTLETNELYRRVSSAERAERMPKNAAALSRDQVERIRRWVEQGTPWPGRENLKIAQPRGFDRWLAAVENFTHRHQFEYEFALPFAAAFVVGQVMLLVLSRTKAAYHRGRPWATSRLGRLGKFAAGLTGRELALAWLVMFAGLVLAVMYGHQRKLDEQLEKLELAQAKSRSPWPKRVYGYPPVPVRPDHPKQVAGTYYRGNCERNPELFNGGNYLTCTFRISLCDADGKVVGVGDAPPPGGLFVRVEIERAPGTPLSLFSEELMSSVFLSKIFYDNTVDEKLRDRPVQLDTLVKQQRWSARVPLGPPQEGSLDGLIYLYTGRIRNGVVRGEPQYAVKYELRFDANRLTSESDLWMSSFGNDAVANPTASQLIPFREWFDYRPIPPITGPNSTDPKLLGVEEYVKKGLIKPEPPPEPKE
jgi:hypothetical protein